MPVRVGDFNKNKKMVRVGVPHFKRAVKNIRDSVYNFETAILDITDNVRSQNTDIGVEFVDDTPVKYRISDDYEPGFENIEEDGESNPFNMGHICEQQKDDKFTSEYGMGLKTASIYMCDKTTVFTRVIINSEVKYVKIVIDVPKMCAEQDPVESYQPLIEEVDYDCYLKNHIIPSGFQTGSSIYLENILTSNDTINGTPSEQIKSLRDSLSKTYHYSIKNGDKVITVNGEVVEVGIDIFEVPVCLGRMFLTNIKVTITEGIITGIYYKQAHNNVTRYKFLNITSGRLNQGNQRDYEAVTCFKLLKLKSTSTFETDCEHIMNYNSLMIIRNGRNHGILDFKELHRKDGWMNHVANSLHYKSKEINTFLGMTSAKRIIERNNPLTKMLFYILKDFTSQVPGIGLNKKVFEVVEEADVSDTETDTTVEEAASEPDTEPAPVVVQPRNNILNISRTPVAASSRMISQSPKSILIYAKAVFSSINNSNIDTIIENASETTQPTLATNVTNMENFLEYLGQQGLEFN